MLLHLGEESAGEQLLDDGGAVLVVALEELDFLLLVVVGEGRSAADLPGVTPHEGGVVVGGSVCGSGCCDVVGT